MIEIRYECNPPGARSGKPRKYNNIIIELKLSPENDIMKLRHFQFQPV